MSDQAPDEAANNADGVLALDLTISLHIKVCWIIVFKNSSKKRFLRTSFIIYIG